MKAFRSLFSLLIVCLACVGCSQENDDVLETQKVEGCNNLSTIEVEFDVEKPSFDDEAGTRVSNAGVWENGDVVYLRLYNSGNKTNVSIQYDGSTQKWKLINAPSNLVNAAHATCSATFGSGVNPVVEDIGIKYSYMTAYYSTTSGQYDFNSSTKKLKVTAKLNCSGWRLRFKGTVGTQLFLYNENINVRNRLCYDCTYDSETGLPTILTVGSDGYTDYYLLGTINEGCDKMVITNLSTGDTFYRSFGTSVVGSSYKGKSFCYTIPTTSNLKGWTLSNGASGTDNSGTDNGHDYVDLGLSSGTLWATCNMGASDTYSYGDYYQWAATSTQTYYSWSTYNYGNGKKQLTKYCDTESYGTVDNKLILDLSDDVAYQKWGSRWRIPTRAMAEELFCECSWCWLSKDGQSGMYFVGSNGRFIFLPAAGYRDLSNKINPGEAGYYQTANIKAGDPSAAFYLYVDNSLASIGYYGRCCGYSVRPVIAQSNHSYVDLGLPSGTLWATSNINADSPSDYGTYLAWAETAKKDSCSWSNYKYGGEKTLTKYCMSSAYGTVDNKSSLDEGDDIARLLWGSGWCMPTKAQLEELANPSICSWKYESSGGGYRVTGPNGNSIFLPLAGEYVDADYKDEGVYGNYWSKSLDTNESSKAFYLFLCKRTNSEVHQVYSGPRRLGQSIRAVVAQ